MNKSFKSIRVGITIGDPSGIGPSIAAKAVSAFRGSVKFFIIGDRWVFEKSGGSGVLRLPGVKFLDLENIKRRDFRFGKIRPEYGKASVEYLDEATRLLKAGEIDCIVTCPVSKEAINLAGYNLQGQTEYFQKKASVKDTVMMLLNRYLRFSLATRHIPIKDVSRALTPEKLYRTVLITRQSLKKLFKIKNPRIVVAGLNPHASDNGVIGCEENRSIRPVVKRLQRRFRSIEGPISSDIAVKKAKDGAYDCVIAAYHDQALIALKLTDVSTGVNLTLGLPFVRTSPLHGTAFDIAGTDRAQPDSLVHAIMTACLCTSSQKKD